LSYPELIAEAQKAEPFRSIINPDETIFANPANMKEAIQQYCRKSGQPVPESCGEVVRCIFESLSLRYREVLGDLKKLSAHPIAVLHVIGGGSKNDLLNQFTANSIGLPVVAGPSEATAIGNIMMQAIASGAASNIGEIRRMINRSIPLHSFEPQDKAVWDEAFDKYLKVINSYK
ncbi:rhamnulokinase, partial [Bacteroides sp. OttesenSCG-928-M17]|nr:rhamnulokinase [Bacteroides sp. OttesenSCG-928-M17]